MAKKCVLLVEDSPEVRRLTRTHLLRFGHEVVEASDGQAALVALETTSPDLICLDLMLPEVSGYEICERIRATPRLSRIPVLVISGRSTPTDRAYALEAGANAYLLKPYHAKQLQAHVTALLGSDAPEGGAPRP